MAKVTVPLPFSHGIGVSQFHDLPETIRKRNEKRRKQAAWKGQSEEQEKNPELKEAPQPARKRGRPKGSKNRKTIGKEALQAASGIVPVKRAPGRPKGRKNNSTLAREAAQAAVILPEVKTRKRGRPAGSKDTHPRTRRMKAEMSMMRRESN